MIRSTPVLRQTLLDAGRAYAKAHRIKLGRVARMAYGDSKFFDRLVRGKSFTTEKYDDVMEWLGDADNWKNGVVSPEVKDLFAANVFKE